jgi:hypothetical protein
MREVVERLEDRIAAIAAIGRLPSGGVRRLAYSPEEREAHALFAS